MYVFAEFDKVAHRFSDGGPVTDLEILSAFEAKLGTGTVVPAGFDGGKACLYMDGFEKAPTLCDIYAHPSDLVGQKIEALTIKDDELHLETDKAKCLFYHSQSCCEEVVIVDPPEDLDDHIGSVILESELVEVSQDCSFLKIRTDKGWITLRFQDQNSTYYSVDVLIRCYPKVSYE